MGHKFVKMLLVFHSGRQLSKTQEFDKKKNI